MSSLASTAYKYVDIKFGLTTVGIIGVPSIKLSRGNISYELSCNLATFCESSYMEIYHESKVHSVGYCELTQK